MLKVYSNDKPVEKRPACIIKMDNEIYRYEDFVVVAYDLDTLLYHVYQNADAVTLGIALHIIKNLFEEAYNNLTPEEKEDVDYALEKGVRIFENHY